MLHVCVHSGKFNLLFLFSKECGYSSYLLNLKLTKLTTFSFSADLESKQITKRLHNQYIDHTYFTKLFLSQLSQYNKFVGLNISIKTNFLPIDTQNIFPHSFEIVIIFKALICRCHSMWKLCYRKIGIATDLNNR